MGIALILFGISAILLSGLQAAPTLHNGAYELLGVSCPIVGVALSVFGFFYRDK